MDLAKIRKKSLLESKGEPDSQPVRELTALNPEAVPSAQAIPASEVIPAPLETGTIVADILSSVQPAFVSKPTESRSSASTISSSSPLEIILAGRAAAGCSEDSILADEGTIPATDDSCLEFLCFRVSDEIYGINIMDIKEIIKPREVTEVPRAPVFVSGVLSLRGTIIPVIDMRLRLGLVRNEVSGKERIVVIKNGASFSGLLVDEVIQVVRVPREAIEPAPAVLDGIDRDFVTGLGRADGRFIIILNLDHITDINLC